MYHFGGDALGVITSFKNLSRVRGFPLDSSLKGHSFSFQLPSPSLLYPRDNSHRAH